MKVRVKDKEAMDAVGRQLIAMDSVPGEELDRVVSDPYLFSRMRSRMTERAAPRSSFAARYAIAFSSIAVFIIAAFAGLKLFQPAPPISKTLVSAPAEMPATMARPDDPPPREAGPDPSPGRAIFRVTVPERASVRTAEYRTAKPRRQQSVPQEMPEFYALSNAGDTRDIADGGHIVRVDIPRSSLFSLGVNVPLENDSETVKADLLVGPDGVTRAIRVLK